MTIYSGGECPPRRMERCSKECQCPMASKRSRACVIETVPYGFALFFTRFGYWFSLCRNYIGYNTWKIHPNALISVEGLEGY